MDNKEPIVWHEPILDEYWDQLEATIDRMRQVDRVTDISDIKITNVEMKKESLAALLTNRSATNSIRTVIFCNSNLCEVGIISLSKLVDVSLQLKTLTRQLQ
jgi:hypothetical protein